MGAATSIMDRFRPECQPIWYCRGTRAPVVGSIRTFGFRNSSGQWPTGELRFFSEPYMDVSKGTAYELEVAQALEEDLASGRFGLIPSRANVRRRPSYFSRDRQKDIVFDVSVEVFREGASQPYWIWVWECKNYDHVVPVDDAEEFHAKLDQIGADRTKGTMISPKGFAKGTVEYARAKGIGLWRYVPAGSLLCLMEDSRGVADSDILRALTIPDTSEFRCYGLFYGLT